MSRPISKNFRIVDPLKRKTYFQAFNEEIIMNKLLSIFLVGTISFTQITYANSLMSPSEIQATRNEIQQTQSEINETLIQIRDLENDLDQLLKSEDGFELMEGRSQALFFVAGGTLATIAGIVALTQSSAITRLLMRNVDDSSHMIGVATQAATVFSGLAFTGIGVSVAATNGVRFLLTPSQAWELYEQVVELREALEILVDNLSEQEALLETFSQLP